MAAQVVGPVPSDTDLIPATHVRNSVEQIGKPITVRVALRHDGNVVRYVCKALSELNKKLLVKLHLRGKRECYGASVGFRFLYRIQTVEI
jgi:hypothetical protein